MDDPLKFYGGDTAVISSTRLDGSKIHVSPHQIEYIEETPDTVIYLVSGKKIIVRESSEKIIKRLTEYWKEISGKVVVKTESDGEDN